MTAAASPWDENGLFSQEKLSRKMGHSGKMGLIIFYNLYILNYSKIQKRGNACEEENGSYNNRSVCGVAFDCSGAGCCIGAKVYTE